MLSDAFLHAASRRSVGVAVIGSNRHSVDSSVFSCCYRCLPVVCEVERYGVQQLVLGVGAWIRSRCWLRWSGRWGWGGMVALRWARCGCLEAGVAAVVRHARKTSRKRSAAGVIDGEARSDGPAKVRVLAAFTLTCQAEAAYRAERVARAWSATIGQQRIVAIALKARVPGDLCGGFEPGAPTATFQYNL